MLPAGSPALPLPPPSPGFHPALQAEMHPLLLAAPPEVLLGHTDPTRPPGEVPSIARPQSRGSPASPPWEGRA